MCEQNTKNICCQAAAAQRAEVEVTKQQKFTPRDVKNDTTRFDHIINMNIQRSRHTHTHTKRRRRRNERTCVYCVDKTTEYRHSWVSSNNTKNNRSHRVEELHKYYILRTLCVCVLSIFSSLFWGTTVCGVCAVPTLY